MNTYEGRLSQKMYGDWARPANVISDRENDWGLIHLNSLQGQPGSTPAKFRCKLSLPVSIDECFLIGFSCTNSIQNLRDAITLDEQGFGAVTAAPPRGFYTYSNLPTLFANFLNSISPSGATYTVSIDPFTYRVTITSTTNFRFNDVNGARNRTYYGIGYNLSVDDVILPYQLSHTGLGVLDLQAMVGNINIRIQEFFNTNVAGLNYGYTYSLDANSVSTGYQFHSSEGTNKQVFKNTGAQRFDYLNIELLNDKGELLPFNGGHVSITLMYNMRKY